MDSLAVQLKAPLPKYQSGKTALDFAGKNRIGGRSRGTLFPVRCARSGQQGPEARSDGNTPHERMPVPKEVVGGILADPQNYRNKGNLMPHRRDVVYNS